MARRDTEQVELERAVLRRTARHPLTLASTALGLGAGVAAALAGSAGAAAVAGAALAVGAGSFLANHFVRRGRYLRACLEARSAERERARLEALGRLRATLFDLARHGAPEGGGKRSVAADLAARGLEQYQRIDAQRELFSTLVGRKLDVGELTYTRYVDAVDHACEAVIGNLSGVADRLSVALGTGDEMLDDAARDAVEARLVHNEMAISALIATATAVAEMRDLDAGDDHRIGAITTDLERLAERAPLYARD